MDGFFEFVCLFGHLVISAAINSMPLFIIVGAITLAGRCRLTARARFALWSLVLVRMILPFTLETPFGLGMFNNLMVSPQTPAVATKDLSMEMSLPDVSAPLNDNPVTVHEDILSGYKWEYVFGLASAFGISGISTMLAAWFLITSIRISRRIRHVLKPELRSWEELLNQGRRQFGIRAPVELRCVPTWTTPATMGVFRPIIVLPEDAATLSESELQHVIWHELAHIKRGDAAWSYLWIVARCLQWWNPSFWWTQRCWLAERELACDTLVIRHLGSTAASDYGRTLIHFLERLSQSTKTRSSFPLPGLVMLLGDKATIRRRLKALAHPLALETFWGRSGSLVLLTLLAVMGLTDAAVTKAHMPPSNSVTVPPGTVWQFGPDTTIEAEAAQLPTTTRNYDVSAALSRIQDVAPNATIEVAIREMIQRNHNIFPSSNDNPMTEHCQVQGTELVVNATEPQHQMIQKLLSHWQQFGQQQVVTEVRMMSTDKQLSDVMPDAGGRIISPTPLRGMDLITLVKSTHEVHDTLFGPSYVRILSPDDCAATIQRLQSDPGHRILHAPKLNMWSGSTGIVNSGTQRPFVTGLRSKQDGTRETQISTVTDGFQIGLAPTVIDAIGTVQLELHIRQSHLMDVEVLQTKMADQSNEMNIQIPHMSESNLKTSVTLASGESLFVSPLRRDKQGKLQMFLITTRAIETP